MGVWSLFGVVCHVVAFVYVYVPGFPDSDRYTSYIVRNFVSDMAALYLLSCSVKEKFQKVGRINRADRSYLSYSISTWAVFRQVISLSKLETII